MNSDENVRQETGSTYGMTEKLTQAVCTECGMVRPSSFDGVNCNRRNCSGICRKTIFYSDATPNAELEKLIQMWLMGVSPADKACAEELEGVIEDE